MSDRKKINSRAKGAMAEREVAGIIRGYGVAARRGQQFSGSADSPDVVADLPGWHLEVKRVENLSLYTAMDQAVRDAGDKEPVVVHRRNRRPWVAIIDFETFLRLVTGKGIDTSDIM